MKLLSEKNHKLEKSNGAQSAYFNTGLSLAPYNVSGYQVCTNASPGCSSVCLYYQGMGKFNTVKQARINKTRWLFEDRAGFLAQLHKELETLTKKVSKVGQIAAIRLNVLSDIPWESFDKTIFTKHSAAQFYDYTKNPKRMRAMLKNKTWPDNYHLTFSLSEQNEKDAKKVLRDGGNVAVVFQDVPDTFWNFPVKSGDEDDLRFLDPSNIVIGLKAKGSAKKDYSGFIRR